MENSTNSELIEAEPQNQTIYITKDELIKNIYADKEVSVEGTIKQYLIVRQEGARKVQRPVIYYNLDMILAVIATNNKKEMLNS